MDARKVKSIRISFKTHYTFVELPNNWVKETNEFEKTVWFLQFAPYNEAISTSKPSEKPKMTPTLPRLH